MKIAHCLIAAAAVLGNCLAPAANAAEKILYFPLQAAAKKAGANAVVGLISWYRKNEFRSATDYECHVGFTSAGVTLKGQVAKIN